MLSTEYGKKNCDDGILYTNKVLFTLVEVYFFTPLTTFNKKHCETWELFGIPVEYLGKYLRTFLIRITYIF